MPPSSDMTCPIESSELRNRLLALAHDAAWCWHEPAQRPFAMLDPVAWEATNHAPIETVHHAGDARLDAAAADPGFLKILAGAESCLQQERDRKRWFHSTFKGHDASVRVAYYCSEFAIHESMQQYSGGLGVLAGDHLKSAEDLGVPLIGVGLLYQHGYYRQQFEADGRTRVLYPRYRFDDYPIEETGVSIHCPIGDRQVEARIWKLVLGSTPIYLLDADLPSNTPEDRLLTEGLYKGEPQRRMEQQVLLGVGGAMAIEALGETVTVHHLKGLTANHLDIAIYCNCTDAGDGIAVANRSSARPDSYQGVKIDSLPYFHRPTKETTMTEPFNNQFSTPVIIIFI